MEVLKITFKLNTAKRFYISALESSDIVKSERLKIEICETVILRRRLNKELKLMSE